MIACSWNEPFRHARSAWRPWRQSPEQRQNIGVRLPPLHPASHFLSDFDYRAEKMQARADHTRPYSDRISRTALRSSS